MARQSGANGLTVEVLAEARLLRDEAVARFLARVWASLRGAALRALQGGSAHHPHPRSR